MRIAVLQMTAGIDPAANAATVRDAIGAAAAGGAGMLFTPEMTGFVDRDRARADRAIVAEDHDAVLSATRAAAAAAGIWVQLGSLAVRGEDGRYRNRSYLIDAAGTIRARYDKLHLFDVDLPGGVRWQESASYRAGNRAVVADTPAGRLGLSICYDLRFPDLYRALTDAGATLLCVPAAFTRPTGEAHWHLLLRARAVEGAAFAVAAAQTGEHADGRTTYGHSMVVDPWGEVLLDMGEAPGLGFAELDLAAPGRVRARLPVLAHRRAIPPVSVSP